MKKNKQIKSKVKRTLPAIQNHKPKLPELTMDIIKRYLNPLVTDEEAYTFLMLCKSTGINPFLREAYLIKYSKDKPAQMVVGKDTFTKRAVKNSLFDGFEAGIIIQTKSNEIKRCPGSFLNGQEGEILKGGYAKVYRKNWSHPIEHEVSLHEYNTGQSSWIKIPATMIRKVALVQALREAFPEELAGLYSIEESGTNEDLLSTKPITEVKKDQKAIAEKSTIEKFWQAVNELKLDHDKMIRHCQEKHTDWKVQHPEDFNILSDDNLRMLYKELKEIAKPSEVK